MLGDITREVVSKSIKFNLTPEQSVDLIEGVLEASGYDTSEDDLWEKMGKTTNYFMEQRDGCYGVSHEQIRNWVKKSEKETRDWNLLNGGA